LYGVVRNYNGTTVDDTKYLIPDAPDLSYDQLLVIEIVWLGTLKVRWGYADADGNETVEQWECTPDCPVRMLDEQSGVLTSGKQAIGGHKRNTSKHQNTYMKFEGQRNEGDILYGDTGFASRFFYTAKSSRSEREHNLLGKVPCIKCNQLNSTTHPDDKGNPANCLRNDHPTVKPLSLMLYLITLLKSPANTLVLDPFMGSGTTAWACQQLGIRFIGIDLSERNCLIAASRLDSPAEVEARQSKASQIALL
jgi:site-specific DNA-methyltransferase (adenine-specific)